MDRHWILNGKAQRLSGDIPGKRLSHPVRGLWYRILIIYRLLFSLGGISNAVALVVILTTNTSTRWLQNIAAVNLVIAVLIRQDMIIRILYTIYSAPSPCHYEFDSGVSEYTTLVEFILAP